MAIRPVKRLVKAKPTIEGAGVRLRRAFGFGATADYDPFLLLDDFRNERPEDYLAGFPWHPHRGIETITYVLAGTVEHGDSMGNRGSIGAGDIQWMTAGRGILHQEMPTGDADGRMHGFQLWANLPSSLKMTAPRYQDVKAADVPVAGMTTGPRCASCAAATGGRAGRWTRSRPEPVYLDVSIPAGKRKTLPVETTSQLSRTCSPARGSSATRRSRSPCRRSPPGGRTRSRRPRRTTARSSCSTGATRWRSGPATKASGSCSSPASPGEPVAWYGPIVMNTQEELRHAFEQLERGTFLRPDAPR